MEISAYLYGVKKIKVMKTLLEQAKPELLAGITKHAEKYAHTAKHIREVLNETYFVNKLTIETWIDIRSIWFVETGELSNHPWDLFLQD